VLLRRKMRKRMTRSDFMTSSAGIVHWRTSSFNSSFLLLQSLYSQVLNLPRAYVKRSHKSTLQLSVNSSHIPLPLPPIPKSPRVNITGHPLIPSPLLPLLPIRSRSLIRLPKCQPPLVTSHIFPTPCPSPSRHAKRLPASALPTTSGHHVG